MKIKKLILQNIGIYVNRNEFNLEADKPIILIGGMNGRGKTTFLEAVLLALYGKRARSLINSQQKFDEYLKRISNVTGYSSLCSAEIHFTAEDAEETTEYIVKRQWDGQAKTIKMSTEVWKNHIMDETLSANWDMFIEEILPHAVAPFFFFDGEKISELASSDNDEQMSASIRSLLGVDIITQLMADLNTVITKKNRSTEKNQHRQQLEEIEKICVNLSADIQEITETKKDDESQLQSLYQEMEELESRYEALGGKYSKDRKKLEESRRKLMGQREEIMSELLELTASSMPLALVRPLLRDIDKKSETENFQKNLKIIENNLPDMVRTYSSETGRKLEIGDFINFIHRQTGSEKSVYGLDEDTRQQLKLLDDTITKEWKTAEMLTEKKGELDKRINEIDNYLEVKVDDGKLTEVYEKIKEKTSKIAVLEDRIESEKRKIEAMTDEQASAEKQKKLILNKVVEEMEIEEDERRIIEYAQKQINILEKYKLELQALKTAELADEMTDCFKKIIIKSGLIDKIDIHPQTLAFSYYNRHQKSIDKSILSAGEKQLLVIAMLWALGICSKAEFPIIIDTPLARLDSKHRESLIRNYFPKASRQVIILSTDEEITREDYSILSPFVGKEYTLVYDEETMSSQVKNGYFGRSQL